MPTGLVTATTVCATAGPAGHALVDLPARHRGPLDDGDVHTRGGEVDRRGEAAHPGADHHYLLFPHQRRDLFSLGFSFASRALGSARTERRHVEKAWQLIRSRAAALA